ncbi:MAG: hypothetical protein B9S33_00140 [Pedosphaera sp. Tous-C6FEB]|nr:MAG: hypothetical protein B9S33_00140 [Pedosphaera sp. Tous-C6FEB]
MQSNWAEENLQVIRTLMERAGLYRRALAPVMTGTGVLAILAAAGARWAQLDTFASFLGLWLAVAVVAASLSLLTIRRQALTAREEFWTPPTRRVAASLVMPFTAAAAFTLPFAGMVIAQGATGSDAIARGLSALWMGFYGCGLNAAGQFTSRGVRLLGWGFMALGALQFFFLNATLLNRIGSIPFLEQPHFLMGASFGGLHLAAGIYLYFTEKHQPTP